jgi:hypothetical protein
VARVDPDRGVIFQNDLLFISALMPVPEIQDIGLEAREQTAFTGFFE